MPNKSFVGVPLIENPNFDNIQHLFPDHVSDIAKQFNANGYAIIDFPDDLLSSRIDRIISTLSGKYDFDAWKSHGWKNGGGLRLTDEWMFNEDIKAIATNKIILDLLGNLYGRNAFPFQTLNFPVGTQQSVHSDAIHFNSFPERWMCGVWVAFEDIDVNNGPLVYYPGSHKWPILWGEHLGLDLSNTRAPGQHLFDPVWKQDLESSGIQPEYFYAKKGQALIWASNLIHGGSKQIDLNRTRWSQVTHYYFEGCTYWRPYASNVSSGEIFSFTPPNILTGRAYSVSEKTLSKLPVDFDAQKYRLLYPDLNCLSDAHAMEHWVLNGQFEGRKYKD